MTETDPTPEPRPTAGEVGLRRQEPGTATPESIGPSLNVPQVTAPHKPFVKPVVSHGRGDPLAGLSEPDLQEAPEAPPERHHRRPRLSEEDRLRGEIVQTREDLGLTVEALAQKADVKARARRRMARTGLAARGKAAAMAGRLRGAAARPGRMDAGPPVTRTGSSGMGPGPMGMERRAVPERIRGAAERMSAHARRRPELIIAAGGAMMAGAGVLNMMERRPRRRH
ncbi:DUF3618 domain-containing protein [Sphaerisporangium corydalis]|uniref:DUF3618 domain-containing protein n=1 Tax=Sphaerisporangium corydalis TaxID=1441875 RepID=A0ABV9E8D1_9ACTN|nr:DUF3618 domain-containing protein [Sphaerisporangium corydalis]